MRKADAVTTFGGVTHTHTHTFTYTVYILVSYIRVHSAKSDYDTHVSSTALTSLNTSVHMYYTTINSHYVN